MLSPFCFFVEYNGWGECGQHLGITEKCNTGNTEEELFRSRFCATTQKCIYYGTTQAWWTSVYQCEGTCDTAFRVTGELFFFVSSIMPGGLLWSYIFLPSHWTKVYVHKVTEFTIVCGSTAILYSVNNILGKFYSIFLDRTMTHRSLSSSLGILHCRCTWCMTYKGPNSKWKL